MKRRAYLQQLRKILTASGSANLVYLNESGFEPRTYRPYGWAYREHQIAGERNGIPDLGRA